MDTGEIKSGPALIDCRATGQFMDQDYVEHNLLSTWKLQCAIPVFNVNGTRNRAGLIMEIVDTILQYNGHTERMSFAVTNLVKQDLILGFTWLQEHNLEIDWQTRKVVMSQCPDKCHTCGTETMTGTAEGRPSCPSLLLRPSSSAFGGRIGRIGLRGFELRGHLFWTRRYTGRRGTPAVCEPPTRGTPLSNWHYFTMPCGGILEAQES